MSAKEYPISPANALNLVQQHRKAVAFGYSPLSTIAPSQKAITALDGTNPGHWSQYAGLIASLGHSILKKGTSFVFRSLGYEGWNVLETLFYGFLNAGFHDSAKNVLDKVESQFPKSARVARMRGSFLLSTGSINESSRHFMHQLQQDETNKVIYKRLIATSLANGQSQEAIGKLTMYLDSFMNDMEGWLELAELYLQQSMYQQAVYVMEELILLSPENHLIHLRYAEILYTMGGTDNIRLSLKEYCRVLELCTDYFRALCGAMLCIRYLTKVRSKGNATDEDGVEHYEDLQTLFEERIRHTISPEASPNLSKMQRDLYENWLKK